MAPPSTTLRLDGSRDGEVLRAAELLRQGELVAIPTETVYGLGGLGLDPDVVRRIFAAKGRPADNPVILHVAGIEAALPLWRQGPDDELVRSRALLLAERFWPGPLTLVAPASPLVPPGVRAGLPSVGVRAPRHPATQRLLAALGEPLAAPSANASGRPSPTRAEDVMHTLAGRIAAILDGGPCELGIESTVVDISGPRAAVLRPGSLSEDEIREVLGELERRREGAPAHTRDASPGLRHRHYAPAVAEVEVAGPDALEAAWSSDAALLLRASTAARLRAAQGERPASSGDEVLPDDVHGFGRELYAALYRIERRGPARLVLEALPADDAWRPLRDRLLRAASR